MATAKLWWDGSAWQTIDKTCAYSDSRTGSSYCAVTYSIRIIAYDDATISMVTSLNAVSDGVAGSAWIREGTKTVIANSDSSTVGTGSFTANITTKGTSFSYSGSVYPRIGWTDAQGRYHTNDGNPNHTGGTITFSTPFANITYNANGGSGAPAVSKLCKYVSGNLSSTAPTRAGFQFLGWATSSSATTATYAAGAAITPTGDMTLYAVWKGLGSTIASLTNSVATQGTFNLTATRYNSAYYSKVTFKVNNTTLATTDKFTTNLTYTVPRSWFNSYTTVTSLTVTAILTTYTDSSCTTTVGVTDSKTFTVTADSGMKPTLASGVVTLSAYNTGTGAANLSNPGYVKGYSKVRAAFNTSKITNANNATTASYAITIQDTKTSGTGTTITSSNTLTAAGTVTVTYTVTDSRGRATSGTANITVNDYASPRITSFTCNRSNSSGTTTDDGTYFAVKAICSYTALSNNAITISLQYRTSSGSYGSATSLTNNTQKVVGGGAINPDTTYVVKVSISDTVGNSTFIEKNMPTREWALSLKHFSSGNGVAVGKASENAKVLEVNNDWYMRTGAIRVIDPDLERGVDPSTTTDGKTIYFTDKNNVDIGRINLRFVSDSRQGLMLSAHRPANGSDVYNALYLYVKSDGSRVVTVSEAAPWRSAIGAVNKAGDTMTGSLIVSRATGTGTFALSTKATNITDGTAPDAETWGAIHGFYDSADSAIGYVHTRFQTDGKQGICLRARRKINGSNTDTYLEVGKDASGNNYVNVSNAQAWRKALGLGSSTGAFPLAIAQGGTGNTAVSTVTTISSIITAASGFSISSATYKQWGKMAMVNIKFKKNGTAVSSNTDMTLGTLVSGKRPALYCQASQYPNGSVSHAWITDGGVVHGYGTWAANGEKDICATFLLP